MVIVASLLDTNTNTATSRALCFFFYLFQMFLCLLVAFLPCLFFAIIAAIRHPAISCFISGQRQLPLNRFIQIVHQAKPSQEDVDEIFNIYLEYLGIPEDALRLLCAGTKLPGSPPEGSVIRDARIAKITENIMSSDIHSEAKVAVYNIIQSTRPAPDAYTAPGADIFATREARISKIIELVMAADIPAEAKVDVFNIIKATRKK